MWSEDTGFNCKGNAIVRVCLFAIVDGSLDPA